MKNKQVIEHILSKDFTTVSVDANGTAVFKKKVDDKTYYLSLHSNRRMQVMDNKSNIKFDGYPETKEEFNLMIKMIRV